MDRQLIDYYPLYLQDIDEIRELTGTEQPEIEGLWNALTEAMKDQFVVDAGAYGIRRWESLFGIIPTAGESLEIRKARIIARMNERVPYTMTTLRQMLENLCGEGKYSVMLIHQEYRVAVVVVMDDTVLLPQISDMLGRVVPANMIIALGLKFPVFPIRTDNSFRCVGTTFNMYAQNFGKAAFFDGENLFDGFIDFNQQFESGMSVNRVTFPIRMQNRNTVVLLPLKWGLGAFHNVRGLTFERFLAGSFVTERSSFKVRHMQCNILWKTGCSAGTSFVLPGRFHTDNGLECKGLSINIPFRQTMQVSTQVITARSNWENKNSARASLCFPSRFLEPCTAGKPWITASFGAANAQAVKPGSLKIRLQTNTIGSFAGVLEQDSHFNLDGIHRLDGSRRLNAIYSKEEV